MTQDNLFLKCYLALLQNSHPTYETIRNFYLIEFSEEELSQFEIFFQGFCQDTVRSLFSYPVFRKARFMAYSKASELLTQDAFRDDAMLFLPWIPEKEILVIGDLHGDIEVFHKCVFMALETIQNSGLVIFLGDYIDRGCYGLNILFGVFLLRILYPEQVFLLRGNHEIWKERNGRIISTVMGDNMFLEFWEQYFHPETIQSIHKVFESLPFILFVGINSEVYMFVHGGIPRPDMNGTFAWMKTLGDLNNRNRCIEMAWSDPEEKEDVIISGGNRFTFARKHFEAFRKKIGISFLIRGHEAVSDGYKEFFDGSFITVFSTGQAETSYPGYLSVRPVVLKIKGGKKRYIEIIENQEVSHGTDDTSTTDQKKD